MTQRRTDQSATHTWLVLMKAHRTLTRHATRSIEALDMCLSDFSILEALLHKGPQSVRELGRRIDLTSGSMTAAIDRLETRHLVARADHATDRRAWVIHLTPAGKALITKVFAGHQGRDGKRDERALASGTRDAHRPVETARHDGRGTTHARRSDPMTVTLDAAKAAHTYAIDKMHSEVAFQVRHLLTKMRRRFTEFAGTVVFDQEHPEHSSASL
jgi:MarR family transcriptional regulator, 2-MHQ and catechol-resistance regulon repressor